MFFLLSTKLLITLWFRQRQHHFCLKKLLWPRYWLSFFLLLKVEQAAMDRSLLEPWDMLRPHAAKELQLKPSFSWNKIIYKSVDVFFVIHTTHQCFNLRNINYCQYTNQVQARENHHSRIARTKTINHSHYYRNIIIRAVPSPTTTLITMNCHLVIKHGNSICTIYTFFPTCQVRVSGFY